MGFPTHSHLIPRQEERRKEEESRSRIAQEMLIVLGEPGIRPHPHAIHTEVLACYSSHIERSQNIVDIVDTASGCC